jgi:hypothetical protein
MNDTVGPDFIKAFVAFQSELPTVKKSATNPHFKSKFAPLDEVNPAVMAALTKHGFAWATMPCVLPDGSPGLRYMLMHSSGDVLTDAMPLLKAGTPQEQGSAITYARRYSIQAVTGVVTDEDDDGNAASRPAEPQRQRPRSQEQEPPATSNPPAQAAPQDSVQAARSDLWAFAQSKGMKTPQVEREFAQFSQGVVFTSASAREIRDFLAFLKRDMGEAA